MFSYLYLRVMITPSHVYLSKRRHKLANNGLWRNTLHAALVFEETQTLSFSNNSSTLITFSSTIIFDYVTYLQFTCHNSCSLEYTNRYIFCTIISCKSFNFNNIVPVYMTSYISLVNRISLSYLELSKSY